VCLHPEYEPAFLDVVACSGDDVVMAADDGLAIVRAAVDDGRIVPERCVEVARPWLRGDMSRLPFHVTAVVFLMEHKITLDAWSREKPAHDIRSDALPWFCHSLGILILVCWLPHARRYAIAPDHARALGPDALTGLRNLRRCT
jgi:hypothetical protein